MSWIKCSDELPPDNEPVWAYCNGEQGRANYYHPDGWDFEDCYVGHDVTNWQPLPPPPKDES